VWLTIARHGPLPELLEEGWVLHVEAHSTSSVGQKHAIVSELVHTYTQSWPISIEAFVDGVAASRVAYCLVSGCLRSLGRNVLRDREVPFESIPLWLGKDDSDGLTGSVHESLAERDVVGFCGDIGTDTLY
jgi:hypothetical protein